MGASKRFDEYMERLAQGLGHSDRHAGLKGYCTGLMLPLSRKSVEPMAARVDPVHASARHQALHHFVDNAALRALAAHNRCMKCRLGFGQRDGARFAALVGMEEKLEAHRSS